MYLRAVLPSRCCLELLYSDANNTNTGRRLASVKDAAVMMLTLQTGLEEVVVRFSQWSNCLVTDPV